MQRLTALHLRGGRGATDPDLRKSLIDRLPALQQRYGALDVIFVTDGLTRSGTAAEFSLLRQSLHEIDDRLRTLGGAPLWILLPSEADLALTERERELLHPYAPGDRSLIDDLSTEQPTPEHRAIYDLLSRRSRQFSDLRTSLHPAGESPFRTGAMPGDCAAEITKNGCRFGVIALNSAFSAGARALSDAQLAMLCDSKPTDWLQTLDASLLVTHCGASAPTESWAGTADGPRVLAPPFTGFTHILAADGVDAADVARLVCTIESLQITDIDQVQIRRHPVPLAAHGATSLVLQRTAERGGVWRQARTAAGPGPYETERYLERSAIEQAVLRDLRAGHHILLSGPCGSGKSWLVHRLLELVQRRLGLDPRAQDRTALLSCALLTKEQRATYPALLAALRAQLGVAHDLGEPPTTEQALRDAIQRRFGSHASLLALDDLDSLRQRPFFAQFVGLLLSIGATMPGPTLLLSTRAGLTALRDLADGDIPPSLTWREHQMPELSPEERRALLVQAGFPASDRSLALLAFWCGGSPLLTQIALQGLAQTDAQPEALQGSDKVFALFCEHLREREVTLAAAGLLRHLAALRKTKGLPAPKEPGDALCQLGLLRRVLGHTPLLEEACGLYERFLTLSWDVAADPQGPPLERAADRTLRRHLQGGSPVIMVVGAPKSGRTQVCLRGQRFLKNLHRRCGYVTLSSAGALGGNGQALLLSTLCLIAQSLESPDPTSIWEQHRSETLMYRFQQCLVSTLRGCPAGPIVIFLDDRQALGAQAAVLSRLLSGLHKARDSQPELQRLIWCLTGTHRDADVLATKLPVTRVTLSDLTFEECASLLPWLESSSAAPAQLLQAVLQKTGGNSALTTQLCQALHDDGPSQEPSLARVQALVQRLFLGDLTHTAERGELFTAVNREFDTIKRKPIYPEALSMYRSLLNKGAKSHTNGSSEARKFLLQSGVARETPEGELQSHNLIYQELFDESWVQQRMRQGRVRFWLLSAAVGLAAVLVLVVGFFWGDWNDQHRLDDLRVRCMGRGDQERCKRLREATLAQCHSKDRMASCVEFGQLLEQGRGGLKEEKLAVSYFERACTRNELNGCFSLGAAQERAQLWDDALAQYTRACDGHIPAACTALARLRATSGVAAIRDPIEAARLWRKACGLQDWPGCTGLAEYLLAGRGGLARNEPEAQRYFQGACDQGKVPTACYQYGLSLKRAQPDRPDRALVYLERACALQVSDACHEAGMMRLEQPDQQRMAQELLETGCYGGNASACYNLGLLFQRTGGHAPKLVVGLFRKACLQDMSQACKEEERARQTITDLGPKDASLGDSGLR